MIKFATEALFEAFRIGDDLLAGREYFFEHSTAPDAHFFWYCRRATQLGRLTSQASQCRGAFKRMQESVKKLLAYDGSE